MADLEGIVALRLDGEDVSLAAVLKTLKISGNLGFFNDAVTELLVERGAKAEGLSVTDEELQEAADTLRKGAGLFKAEDTHRWLENRKWSVEDFETGLERRLLRQKLLEKIATREKIDGHFAEHRDQYDRAVLAHIVVPEKERAEELRSRIGDGADFTALAREHSVDQGSGALGGELGTVYRGSLQSDVARAIFAAREGDVVGPIHTQEGHHLFQVRRSVRGELDSAAASVVARKLFAGWLQGQAEDANVEITLHETI